MAFQPIEIGWAGKGEVLNLMKAEWQGGQPLLSGEALFCGYYLNELLMHLLPREDPHEQLFAHYTKMLARLAAERGAPPVVLNEARECLRDIDTLLGQSALDADAFSCYVGLNGRFHALLSEMSGSAVIGKELERVCSLPFASHSGFVVVQANSPKARDMLLVAQDQHWQVIDAIELREGSRAESLMREHSRIAQRNLREAVLSQRLDQMPGVRLIRKRS